MPVKGFLYLGLCQQYLVAPAAHEAGDENAATAALKKAAELYGQAAVFSPEFFPIYFDWSIVTSSSRVPTRPCVCCPAICVSTETALAATQHDSSWRNCVADSASREPREEYRLVGGLL